MLEVSKYRQLESVAKSKTGNWRVAQAHNLDHFEKYGFPVRLNSMSEAAALLDTMQENRFDAYMRELGGITDKELEILLSILVRHLKFQKVNFPEIRPIIPFSTMMAFMALYRKLIAIAPNAKKILEIGPGCGYFSFYVNYLESIKEYCQVEACESFYILQNLVNTYVFQENNIDLVSQKVSEINFNYNFSPEVVDSEREAYSINWAPTGVKCIHSPWWDLNSLKSNSQDYDVIMANANLSEMNNNAMRDYIKFSKANLNPNGFLLVQCFGFEHNSLKNVFLQMKESGFAPLFLVHSDHEIVTTKKSWLSHLVGNMADQHSDILSSFVSPVSNGLFVREGHPLFGKYFKDENYNMDFNSNEDVVIDAYFRRPINRRILSKSNLFNILKERL